MKCIDCRTPLTALNMGKHDESLCKKCETARIALIDPIPEDSEISHLPDRALKAIINSSRPLETTSNLLWKYRKLITFNNGEIK